MKRRVVLWVLVGVLWVALSGCRTLDSAASSRSRTLSPTPPPTPSVELLKVNGVVGEGARLRVTLPTVKLRHVPPDDGVQLLVVLAAPDGAYAYLLFPANRAGDPRDLFELTAHPLEIALQPETKRAALWVLAVRNRDYTPAERFGVDALAASLAYGFQQWLAGGNPEDDPLAAVVSASEGALYAWFANVDVVGQALVTLHAENNWGAKLSSHTSADGGLNVIYTAQYLSAEEAAQLPTATPQPEHPGYVLRVDEDFAGGQSDYTWFQGQDSTYINQLTDGAYEIRLLEIQQRDFALSWGSLEGLSFENYILEARVRLVEDDVQDARYGIWFNYQDDYNFVYFGISNSGEYRAAVIRENKRRVELQDWTPHPAIRSGAAVNTLTVESHANGDITLSANGEVLGTFNDATFTRGSVAFFCYAKSTPTTCRLERLRIWEQAE